MKKIHFILFVILAMLVVSVKSQNKTQKNDEMPSKQELEEMMKEMQKEMEDMDPESKEMLKQMGIQMPDMKNLEFAVSGNYEESGPIPIRDEARIQKALQTKVTDGNLAGYIQSVNSAVNDKVGPNASKDGKEIYQFSKANGGGSQAANGLWIFGANLPAVLILGNALLENPKDADNLNNYAAFLIMTGAEEAALPILYYLETKYPRNSTVLNNIGQGWFGLGDLDKATEYLDKALALYPGHSQANFTKSFIQESKGDKSGALSSMKKSIKTGYSSSKESRMAGFNYQLKSNDIDWNPPFPQDPLGFGQMNWPKYPQSVEESPALEKEWEVYKETTRAKSAVIEQKYEKAEKDFEAIMEDPIKMMGAIMKTNLKMQKSSMPFASKAKLKLEYYNENDDKLELEKYQNQMKNLEDLEENIRAVEDASGKKREEIEATLGRKIGEGSTEADMTAYCAAVNKNNDNYLQAINQVLEAGNAKSIKYWREAMSRRLNYYQYAMPEESFEMEKLRAQMMWLSLIGEQEVRFQNKCTFGGAKEQEKPKAKKLADFYDMNCKQKSVMNLGIGSVTIECNKMTTELEAGFLKYSQRENMDNGTIIRGTVEIGKDFGIGKGLAAGPVKAELKAGAGAFIEFDSEGITDAGVKGGVSVEVGSNIVSEATQNETGIGDQGTAVFGAEARWGWNSGGSLAGKGLLSGLSIK